MTALTHKQLVKRAGAWLRNTIRCGVVMEEFTAYVSSNEIPDVIGWCQQQCILVECKTSKADFRVDQSKPARREGARALGHWRFYFTTQGIIPPTELPAGWGLYEVHERQVRYVAGKKYSNGGPRPFQSDRDSEVGLLLSAIRRLQISTAVFVREVNDERFHLREDPLRA